MRHQLCLLLLVFINLAGGIATVAATESSPKQTRTPPPNIVLILCDNLGYGDIGCYHAGSRDLTPHIDKMAADGIKFTDAYAAAPVCTPSRAALLTGCYPRRVGLDLTPGQGAVLRPGSPYGLNPEEITLAEILKSKGYATLCIGKWHLGDQLEFFPTRQGFDHFFGIPYSDDMTTNAKRNFPTMPWMQDEKVTLADDDLSHFTQRGTDRAVAFMEEHRDQPFFLYFPQVTPGSTTRPPVSPDFQEKSHRDRWSDSIMELDGSVGRILESLDRLGLSERTLVLFTSDNGAPFAGTKNIGSNLPLKGHAYSVAEGGMRMPLIAHWPGKIPTGSVSSEMVTLMDLFPTIANLADAELPTDRTIDGRDIRPLLMGDSNAKSPHEAFYYYFLNQLQAVRSGPWKLYLPNETELVGFGPKTAPQSGRLFNLVDDPEERQDCLADQPDVVKRLLALADSARADLGDRDLPGKNVRPVGKIENPTLRLLNP